MVTTLNFCSSFVQGNKTIKSALKKNYITKKEKNPALLIKSSIEKKNYLNEKVLKKIFPLIICANLIFNPLIANAVPEQRPLNKVIDESGVLTKSSVSYIEKSVSKIKETKQEDVYFVLLRNLPYEKTPQEYAQELFQKWNLGENDVVVVLASKIAKGGIYYGNEVKNLSEAVAKSIGEETYPFKAKEEQYSSAALDVSNRLVAILTDKGDPGAPVINRGNNSSSFKSAKNTEEQRAKYIAIIVILLIIAFVVPMFQFFYYVKDE